MGWRCADMGPSEHRDGDTVGMLCLGWGHRGTRGWWKGRRGTQRDPEDTRGSRGRRGDGGDRKGTQKPPLTTVGHQHLADGLAAGRAHGSGGGAQQREPPCPQEGPAPTGDTQLRHLKGDTAGGGDDTGHGHGSQPRTCQQRIPCHLSPTAPCPQAAQPLWGWQSAEPPPPTAPPPDLYRRDPDAHLCPTAP